METEDVKIKLRKAQMWDLFHTKDQKRLGQPFWLKSLETGLFDNKAYIVEPWTNSKELKAWIETGMVWIPMSGLDIKKKAEDQPKAPQLPPNHNQEILSI